MTRSTETPEARRARYSAEIDALPPEQAERLRELRGIVEAAREAARIAMLAYVRAEMATQTLSADERADLERFFNGVPGDDRQMSQYGADTRHAVAYDIHHAHDYVRHVAMRGRVVGEAA